MYYFEQELNKDHVYLIQILASFFIALVLENFPMPAWLSAFAPHWLLFLCIHWSYLTPHLFGVVGAWGVGILVDVMTGATLGLNALLFALSAYAIQLLYTHLRMFSLVQQLLMLFILITTVYCLKLFVQMSWTDLWQTQEIFFYLIMQSGSTAFLWLISYFFWHRASIKQVF